MVDPFFEKDQFLEILFCVRENQPFGLVHVLEIRSSVMSHALEIVMEDVQGKLLLVLEIQTSILLVIFVVVDFQGVVSTGSAKKTFFQR